MTLAFNWANWSDNATTNAATSFNVGASGPQGANGTFTAGNLLIGVALVTTTANATDPGSHTWPAGWTRVVDNWDTNPAGVGDINYHYSWAWRIADGSEAGSFAVSWVNTSRGASWALFNYSNPNASPIDASNNNDTTTGAANHIIAPSISPAGAADIMLIIGMYAAQLAPYTLPGAFTQRALVGSTSSTRPEIIAADLQLSASGATGTQTINSSFSAASAISIAISPGAAGAAPGPVGMSQGFLFHPGAGPTFELRGRSAFPDPVVIPPPLPGQIGVPLGYLFRPGSGPGKGIVSARNQAFPDSPPGSGGGGAFQGKEFFSPVGQLM